MPFIARCSFQLSKHLYARRLLLFLFTLLFLLRCLGLLLLLWRGPRFSRRRSALRCSLLPLRFGFRFRRWRTIRFRTIVRLRRWRTIRLGSVRLIRLGTIIWLLCRRTTWLRSIVRLRRWRTIRLGSVGLIRLGTVIWLLRRRTIWLRSIVRLRRWRTIRLRRTRRARALIGCGLVARTIPRLICRRLIRWHTRSGIRLTSGLARSASIRLTSGLAR